MHVTEETTPPLMHKNYAICICSLTSTKTLVANLDYVYSCTQFPDIQPSYAYCRDFAGKLELCDKVGEQSPSAQGF